MITRYTEEQQEQHRGEENKWTRTKEWIWLRKTTKKGQEQEGHEEER